MNSVNMPRVAWEVGEETEGDMRSCMHGVRRRIEDGRRNEKMPGGVGAGDAIVDKNRRSEEEGAMLGIGRRRGEDTGGGARTQEEGRGHRRLSLIHISEPTRPN